MPPGEPSPLLLLKPMVASPSEPQTAAHLEIPFLGSPGASPVTPQHAPPGGPSIWRVRWVLTGCSNSAPVSGGFG